MKFIESRLNLRFYAVIILVSILLLAVTDFLFCSSTERVFSQLNFYRSQGFSCIYETDKSVGNNDYIYFNRNLSLKTTNSEAFSPIVLMETNSDYNKDVVSLRGNEEKLAKTELAISQNISAKYNLFVGDTMISKHKVLNREVSYTVVEIIQPVYGLTNVDVDSDVGIVIMGYDADYIENTNYTHIAFSSGDPANDVQSAGGKLISLTDKESEMFSVIASKLGVFLVAVCLILLETICLNVIVWKSNKGYYQRLRMNGVSTKIIFSTALKVVLGINLIIIGLSFGLGLLIGFMLVKRFVWFLATVNLISELLVVIVSVIIYRKKLREM
jgi:hypothetical protein